MNQPASDAPLQETSRTVSIRYFNLYRLVLASAFVIFSMTLKMSEAQPEAFRNFSLGYWLLALGIAFLPTRINTRPWVLFVQVSLDILILTGLMHLDSARSGIPFLLMTTIAGAALVSEGRMVFGFAAFATIALLVERAWRFLGNDGRTDDFSRVGMIGMGFFAIALLARLLARRALVNETLARERGAALARQVRVNADIIRDMQDGVVVVDAQGLVSQSNPAADALLGMPLQAGMVLKEVSVALAQLALHGATDVMPVFMAETSGRSLRLRVVATDLNGGRILYLEDLDRVQAQAQQIKLAALGRLTANIAHEIRNPLSSISHASELMLEEKRVDMQARLSHIIRENTQRIERIVRNVLELGRRDRVTAEALDPVAVLKKFLDDLSLSDASVATRVVLLGASNTVIWFDRLHLHQVLSNVVGNALRFATAAQGAVTIEVLPADGQVRIAVKDDGPGIAEADRSKIFEPFFTSDPQGNGLGLYIARELAEANGGRLVLAASASGAEFHLYARSAA